MRRIPRFKLWMLFAATVFAALGFAHVHAEQQRFEQRHAALNQLEQSTAGQHFYYFRHPRYTLGYPVDETHWPFQQVEVLALEVDSVDRSAAQQHLSALSLFPEVQDVCCMQAQLADVDLEHLENKQNVRYLVLGANAIHGSGLKYLEGLKSLETLYVNRNPITDQALTNVVLPESLRVLDLSETKISDAALAELRHLKNLEVLYLGSTGVTYSGVQDLKKHLPRVELAATRYGRCIFDDDESPTFEETLLAQGQTNRSTY